MGIRSIRKPANTPDLINRVDERAQGDTTRQDRQQQRDEQNPRNSTEVEVTETSVRDAIHQFTHDLEAQRAGLQAEVAGQGPGLVVVLKDGRGAFLRQMSGEEFLKLRQSIAGKSGKILDRKL
jgi:hypothetical protein